VSGYIAIWDPGADDSSRLSAQEDTAAHTGYSVIQGEIAPSDGVQWHTGVPSGTVDSRTIHHFILCRECC
jgi:hypothetical protein